MPDAKPDTEIRLPNGDILIAGTKDRDPQVDAAFKLMQARARPQIRALFEKYARAQQAA